MADNSRDPKKNSVTSFVVFALITFLLLMMVQSLLNLKVGNVAFSYQLEHVVNLGLIEPEESRKTALNDNLVTFSGKFREEPAEFGKDRFKYLTLLNSRQEIIEDEEGILMRLGELEERVREAGDLYLHLSGERLSPEGFVIVDEVFDTPDRENRIILAGLSDRSIESLPDLQRRLTLVKQNPTEAQVDQMGRSVSTLVRFFRSPVLGIGSQELKETLNRVEQQLVEAGTEGTSASQALGVYDSVLAELQGVISDLGGGSDGLRLSALRSVRDYSEELSRLNALVEKREENLTQLDKARVSVEDTIWFFNNQELSTRALEKQDVEQLKHWYSKAKQEWEAFDRNKGAVFKAPDQPLNTVLEKTFKSEPPAPNYFSYLMTLLPVLLVILVLYFVFSRQMKGMGNSAMNFGKSPARMLQQGESRITFKDVAGCDEAKEELYEIVDFLKSPQKFTALGGRIPKGVLCVGPPGTGKTLIAKAVAGEANRPFFSISGSDFVEMFVGVGASRIRDMFEQAKKNAPCIIFMDEIDAVGRHRGAGIGGGHDEREQTLNQLLVEMDGFDTNEGIILMAATNRPDVLDKALLRPGRFDRRVVLDLPDIKGRYDILKVHARKIKLDSEVDLMSIARGTPGASGADLENILNEAALLAARRGRSAVTNVEAREARDKVLFGKERRSLQLDEDEKRTTAYHESGHAVVGLLVEHSDTVDKVTIIPRGQSLGATYFLPKKNRVSYWRNELLDQLAVLMGGRCAEEIFLDDYSSGAQQDISQATQLARSMVCQWGMSEKLGKVAYDERSESGRYLGMNDFNERTYSEETARQIDQEVRELIDEAYNRARNMLVEHRESVELMAQMLIEFETLDLDDCRKIVIDKNWDVEEKRRLLQAAEDAHKSSEKDKESTEETAEDSTEVDRGAPPMTPEPSAG